jgi:hypothetical protein
MTKSNNVQVVELADGRRVCLSYGVIVAAFIPADFPRSTELRKAEGSYSAGYLRTDARYSVTTSRHMNQFAGKDAPIVSDATLRALVAPVVDTRG